MTVFLHGVTYHLPDNVVTNDDLVRLNPTWDAESIFRKTGIRERRVAAANETSTDFAEQAALTLIRETRISPDQIDALIFCTQTPDYLFPASSCILHGRLGLSSHCGVFDFNLGCSGFTYGLWLSRALIESGSARNVLLVAGDTLSKECGIGDQVTIPIFGDGAGAALLSHQSENAIGEIGTTLVGTDGRGWEHLRILGGGSRCPAGARQIEMNGAEVFNFTLTAISEAIGQQITNLKLTWDEIDRFLLHQANGFILETLRKRMKLSPERCPIDISDTGNTSSASLPVLFRRCLDRGDVAPGHQCILAGYGVGYSWAITSLKLLKR